jgi:hypothetical protein
MLAHHPTTGQPIRILRSDVSISSDMKTLVWLREGFQESHRWKRWYSIITEVGALHVSDSTNNLAAVIIPLNANLDEWIPLLPTIFHNNSKTLLVAPNSVLQSLTERGFTTNLTFAFEELYDYYPYLGEPVQESDSIEKVILSIAHILRIPKVVWTSPSIRSDLDDGCRVQYDAWSTHYSESSLQTIPIDSDDSCIPRTWLIQQYFRHPNSRRAREIFSCLEKNIACEFIDTILLLNEHEYNEILASPKIRVESLSHRITYYDVFKAIRDTIPAGDFVLFSNSDIWFDRSLQQIWSIGLKERSLFLALLRWEDGAEPTLFGPRADSQDAWIIARDAVTFDITEKDFGFPFGKPGCDNAIALIMMSKRLLVSNPAYSIRCMHVHSSNIRNYDPKDILYRTHYLYVDPTVIQPIKVARNLEYGRVPAPIMKSWILHNLGKSFPRPITCIRDTDIVQICENLRLKGEIYTPHEQNMYTPNSSNTPLYNFKGGHFVTANGLISSFKELIVGEHSAWKEGIEANMHTTLVPSIHVPTMIACPCDPICETSLAKWVLHYLPRVMAIRKIVKEANLPVPEFLVPQHQDIGAFLNDCVWGDERQNITVTPMLSDMNYYSESVWAVPPSANSDSICAEDIELLRGLLPSDSNTNSKYPIVVFCVEDDEHAVCTRGWAEETAENIMPKGWIVRYVSHTDLPSVRRKAFQDASWIIGSGSALDWIWYAPKGAHVFEFMSDRDCRGDHIHLAGAAGLHYVTSLINTEEHVVFQRQNALLDVGKAIKLFGFKEMLDVVHNLFQEKPRIIIPSGKALEGIHNHIGNGFREIATMWANRGYVNLVHTEDTHYCWWGGIGEVLLYDRESIRWWYNIPSYQMALFGNCLPPAKDVQRLRQSVWSFWPYSPRAVEGVVSRVENMRGYDSRPIQSLFLGRVSNGLQKIARCAIDWSTSVELFSMPVDSTDTPYPFTQEEYLSKLCSARFGLSLPGNGQKCNREIEYFACGCVPIIVDGVDMKSYLVPPIEGIHYFKASTPDDVKRIVKNTSPSKWAAMSAAGRNWWRNYASVEGLFRLTWARIEQCKPYYNVGIPATFTLL